MSKRAEMLVTLIPKGAQIWKKLHCSSKIGYGVAGKKACAF